MQQIFWAKTRPNRGKMETGPTSSTVHGGRGPRRDRLLFGGRASLRHCPRVPRFGSSVRRPFWHCRARRRCRNGAVWLGCTHDRSAIRHGLRGGGARCFGNSGRSYPLQLQRSGDGQDGFCCPQPGAAPTLLSFFPVLWILKPPPLPLPQTCATLALGYSESMQSRRCLRRLRRWLSPSRPLIEVPCGIPARTFLVCSCSCPQHVLAASAATPPTRRS